jgi:hypothetical protein
MELQDVVLSLEDFVTDLPSVSDIVRAAQSRANKEEPWFDLLARLLVTPEEAVETELACLELSGVDITWDNEQDWPRLLLPSL